jgi:hypothetical protein
MEKRGKSIFGGMKIVGNFYSAASRQAKEAEFDGPSKRSYRLMYGSGSESFAPPTDSGAVLGGGIARTKIGLRAFLDCLIDAKNRVEWSRTDGSTRRFYQKLPE